MTDSALMALTEERIDSNAKLQTFVQRANAVTIPLFPETVQFTDTALKYGAAIVTVDTNVDKYGNNRDIYRNESGGFCLHLSKLNEIAQQAGLQITDSRPLERRVDEQGRVVFINHQVKWKMRSVDGSIKEGVATGKYDYYNDLATQKEGQVKSRRKHADALAESNAMTRAYNKAIAQIPQSFTLNELRKPFLIPYVLEDKEEVIKDLPLEEQIIIRKELARKRLGLMDAIYSPPENSPKQIEEPNYTVVDEDEQIKQPGNSGVDKPPISSSQVIANAEEPSSEEQNRIIAEEYRNTLQKERTEKILNLIQLKNYQDPNGLPFSAARIEKNSEDAQIKFIEKLLNLPDAEGDDLV